MIETTDLKGVELLYEGEFKPITGGTFKVTGKDIDDMRDNTEKLMQEIGLDPTLVLDHGNPQGTAILQHVLKSMSLGKLKNFVVKTAEKMGRQVKTLVADITGVPVKLAELISKGFADRRSGEFYRSPILAKKNNGLFLKSLAIFGAGIPAVKMLNDMAEGLFAMQEPEADQSLIDDNSTVVLLIDEEFQNQNKTEEKELRPMDELKVLQNENEALKIELQEIKSKIELSAKVTEVETEKAAKIAELQEQLDDTSKQLKEMSEKHNAMILLQEKERESKITDFVDGIIEAGKVEPAKKDSLVAMFKGFGDNEEMIALQMEILSGKDSVMPKEKLPKATAKGQAAVVDGVDDMETMELKVAAYCKENEMNPMDAKDYGVAIRALYNV